MSSRRPLRYRGIRVPDHVSRSLTASWIALALAVVVAIPLGSGFDNPRSATAWALAIGFLVRKLVRLARPFKTAQRR